MTVQTFRELLTKRPFNPFRLVMSSGQSYEVRHPEMALLTQTDKLVGTGGADDGVPAEFKICSLPHVTAVEPLTAKRERHSRADSIIALDGSVTTPINRRSRHLVVLGGAYNRTGGG